MEMEIALGISALILTVIFLILLVMLATSPPKKKNKVREDLEKIKEQINGKG